MDGENQLRSEVPDSSKNTSLNNSQLNDHYMTANDSSKYYSLSDADCTLEGASTKTASPTQINIDSVDNNSETSTLISSLSPISQKNDNFEIGKQIEAANILSGGVDIFDNDNSYDGDELVIDDNVAVETVEEKPNVGERQISQPDNTPENKIHGNTENILLESESAIPSKDTEVILQIDGKNVDAIDIGNGLYLYRKDDKELAAVQILDANEQQPSFKFLKVRENAEGNLEVYEEIVELHKESPENDENVSEKGVCHVPIKDINEVINDHSTGKVTERKMKIGQKETTGPISIENEREMSEYKHETNLNGKNVKTNDNSRNSPVIGSFTPMTFHSTPNKERIPLTKTMVDMQLHPNRHTDSAKKTIEVNTDNCRQKSNESVFVHMKEVQKDFKTTSIECSQFSEEKLENIPKHVIETEKHCLRAETKVESLDSKTLSSKELEITPKNQQGNIDEKVLNSGCFKMNESKNKKLYDNEEPAVITSELNDTTTPPKSKSVVEVPDNNISKSNLQDTKIVDEQPNPNTKILNSNKLTSNNSQILNAGHSLCIKEDAKNECKKEKVASITKIRETELYPCVDNNILKTQNKDKIKSESFSVKSKLEDPNVASNSPRDNKLNFKNNLESDAAHEKIKNVNKIIIKTESEKTNEVQKKRMLEKPKAINNNIPVPFGKWTEANKQEYLNKIKESKVSSFTGSTNQIKQPKDLNRRDVLNKIDIARHTSQIKESFSSVKSSVKSETVKQINIPSVSVRKNKTLNNDATLKTQIDHTVTAVKKSEPANRTEINNQDLIDKTIEGILMDKIITSKVLQENDTKSNTGDKTVPDKALGITFDNKYGIEQKTSILDDIERQLNELHGQPNKPKSTQVLIDSKISNVHSNEVVHPQAVSNKMPSLAPLTSSNVTKLISKDLSEYSDEEILECEPVTGDIELDHKLETSVSPTVTKDRVETFKKESGNVITEKDFEKFARRNSVTYDNCITVNFANQQQTNLIQNVTPKDMTVKKDLNNTDAKSKCHFIPVSIEDKRIHSQSKFSTKDADIFSSNNAKLKVAHHTSLNSKREKESPITVIEDKPVKVIFVDSANEFQPFQLNAQGQQLTSKDHKDIFDCDSYTVSSCDSLDSDILEARDDNRPHEDIKVKAKHQRKQVLTPVDIPDMELIEPKDLGIETKHKRKRKTEDLKRHLEINNDQPGGKKNAKNLVPKKSYLLGRSVQVKDKEHADKLPKAANSEENIFNIDKEPFKQNNMSNASNVSSVYLHNVSNPIDNLVKAAELLEKQTQNNHHITHLETSTDSSLTDSSLQPIKRGRGRPRKYPVQDTDKSKVSSPQKKPKLMETVVSKTETSDEDSDEEGIARENWTMGKINENIVCPICNKLFRSENVVFKHVKHCSGPSPTKGNSPERKSPKLDQHSYKTQEQTSSTVNKKEVTTDQIKKSTQELIDEDIIVIEDSVHDISSDISPIKSTVKSETKNVIDTCNRNFNKQIDSTFVKDSSQIGATQIKSNTQQRPAVTNIVCEICGKTFRQLSYLINHKLLHKKSEMKKSNSLNLGGQTTFTCEVCKKEFRKLHHLVQHRFNHNPTINKMRRKSSVEQNEQKLIDSDTKSSEDQGAGFRCEPCDKSFRKLHHLVEHRENHDNKAKSKNIPSYQNNLDKNPTSPPQCDICNKTFRKLHHMIEHKEQHLETKNCGKTNNATLIARDIIHECSLCYMVFPNEHALNKHFVICQRKKKSAKLKKDEKRDEMPGLETENVSEELSTNISQNSILKDDSETVLDNIENDNDECAIENGIIAEKLDSVDKNCTEPIVLTEPAETDHGDEVKEVNNTSVFVTEKAINTKTSETDEINMSQSIPKEKTPLRDKIELAVTKSNRKSRNSIAESMVVKNDITDSDEDIRYMFNPNYKADETIKNFMKVRANRRNSLVCGSSKFVTRRMSTRYSPKVHGNKAIEKPKNTIRKSNLHSKSVVRTSPKKKNAVPSANTDSSSDESEIKYSFPKSVTTRKSMRAKTPEVPVVENRNRKTRENMDEKIKTSAINVKKTLGKTVPDEKSSSTKLEVKRRVKEVGHKCDCGQLFNSAALLARHTTLMHTPPRRRRLSPAPPVPATSTRAANPSTTPKPRRNAAHRGIPVPEKMKKIKDKLK